MKSIIMKLCTAYYKIMFYSQKILMNQYNHNDNTAYILTIHIINVLF